VCVFFKARGGAAMALNVLKVQVMWVGKCLESSGVRDWVCGRGKCSRGCGREKCVESLWKVRRNGRGKCAESWRV